MKNELKVGKMRQLAPEDKKILSALRLEYSHQRKFKTSDFLGWASSTEPEYMQPRDNSEEVLALSEYGIYVLVKKSSEEAPK